jgi:hypothetical protein
MSRGGGDDPPVVAERIHTLSFAEVTCKTRLLPARTGIILSRSREVVANVNIVVTQAARWGFMQRIIGLGLEVMDLHLVTLGPQRRAIR